MELCAVIIKRKNNLENRLINSGYSKVLKIILLKHKYKNIISKLCHTRHSISLQILKYTDYISGVRHLIEYLFIYLCIYSFAD